MLRRVMQGTCVIPSAAPLPGDELAHDLVTGVLLPASKRVRLSGGVADAGGCGMPDGAVGDVELPAVPTFPGGASECESPAAAQCKLNAAHGVVGGAAGVAVPGESSAGAGADAVNRAARAMCCICHVRAPTVVQQICYCC